MHTITISVNCVGVMGKGLALKIKNQFPDVYMFYQDLCHKRIFKKGKSCLYKRKYPFNYQSANKSNKLLNTNLET